MNLLQTLLMLAVAGLLIGGLARILLPGRESIGVFGTILAGLAGSFIGGLIMAVLFNNTNPWINLIAAVACAVLFIIPFRMYAVHTVVVPGAPVRRGFFGSRSVDRGYDPGYDAGYAPAGRRPFWGRRRGLF